eukprot:5288518-Prymnesium_polylepis.1
MKLGRRSKVAVDKLPDGSSDGIVKVPKEANTYAFGYPLESSEAAKKLGADWYDETDASEVAIRRGFFIYWDIKGKVLAVHALATVSYKLMLK